MFGKKTQPNQHILVNSSYSLDVLLNISEDGAVSIYAWPEQSTFC